MSDDALYCMSCGWLVEHQDDGRCGRCGKPAYGGSDRLASDVAAHNPDIVVVSYGVNDSDKWVPLYKAAVEANRTIACPNHCYNTCESCIAIILSAVVPLVREQIAADVYAMRISGAVPQDATLQQEANTWNAAIKAAARAVRGEQSG